MKQHYPLNLNLGHLPLVSEDDLRRTLDQIFASTDYVLDYSQKEVWLNGSKVEHLYLDPELNDVLAGYGISDNVGSQGFHSQQAYFDLCFEDSWTGITLARVLQGFKDDDIVIIHLDDHADMMPCLLEVSDDGILFNPAAGQSFDKCNPDHWASAIQSGIISIGSYLTPLFHQGSSDKRPAGAIHLRHVRPNPQNENQLQSVEPSVINYDVLEPKKFASLRFGEPFIGGSSYLETKDFHIAFEQLPRGKLIVHIDLDFFINDFNGNSGERPKKLTEDRVDKIKSQMDALKEQIVFANRPVEAWVIATSPGFCASRHWEWLLSQLEVSISATGYKNLAEEK